MIEKYQAIICEIAREVFHQPTLAYADSLAIRDIPGFDSVLAIQFILTIENALQITLNEEEVDNMHTMGDLLKLIQAKKTT